MFRSVLAACVLAAAPTAGFAAEKIDNPEFKSWAGYKPGASVTLKTVTDFAGNKTESLMTNKLVEVGADKLVIETTTVTKVAGMEIAGPPFKRDVPKMLDGPTGKPAATVGKPEGTFENGTEEVKIAGTAIKTKWYKFKLEKPVQSLGQTWMSDEVPGMIVKSVTKLEGQVASTTTMELVEIKK